MAAVKRNADGFAAKVLPTIQALYAQHKSLRKVAAELDRLGVQTARGKSWTAMAVKNVLDRQRASDLR